MVIIRYLILAVIIYFMNVVPAFMPPTWLVVAVGYLKYHLLFFPTIIIGASGATLGRITLYHLSKKYFPIFFSKTSKENFKKAGKFLNQRKHVSVPIILAYTLMPVPSNQVFIAAGLADFDIRVMSMAFFVGRLVSYALWVGAAKFTTSRLDLVFIKHLSRTQSILIDIGGFLVLYLISSIKWEKIFKKKKR